MLKKFISVTARFCSFSKKLYFALHFSYWGASANTTTKPTFEMTPGFKPFTIIKPCKSRTELFIINWNLCSRAGENAFTHFHSFIKHMHTNKAKKYISYLLFSLKPFIFANNILNIRSRCSQVSSAMSTFPWIPVHRSASLRSSKTLFVLLSNWRKVLTRGKSPWPACASSMRCW